MTTRPSGEAHALAALEHAALRAVRHPEGRRDVDVEAARARVLDERVADRRHTVVDGERLDPVPVPLEHGAGLELHGRERIRQPSEDAPKRREELVEARRSVDRQRHLAAPQRERLQHPGEAEVVVGVVVREEDLLELDEADVAAQELPLRAFRAVEQETVAATPHERRAQRALRRGHGA